MDYIIQALVEAGYFRARISTLSDFDKVIGGMAWAMQVFSQEIDINILYRDTLDLGQKIALTERLVMVLLVMNCPHKIEPHQIVGLDHANLLPVIRWLIKRSSEVRREHEAFNRLLALRHYHRVTNTSVDRKQWCHVLKIDQLREIAKQKTPESATRHNLGSKEVTKADLDFIERLRKDFKDNQLISFVDSQPVFSSTVDNDRIVQIDDDHESINPASDDELDCARETSRKSDSNKTQTENIHQGDNNDGNNDLVTEEPFQESPELIALNKELDTELLATNQKILTQLKKLDAMPTDLEIIQYQRRYIELHQELISKNKDLKKIYALYNSLDSVKHYLNKELNLLDSIMANLELTNNNSGNRFEFLKQFQDIIKKIQTVRGEVDDRLSQLRNRCILLNEEYADLQRKCCEDE